MASKLLSNLVERDRARWTWWVGRFLEDRTRESKERVWKDWISSYWDNRNHGKPSSLADSEKEEMLKWALELDSLFPDAAQKIFETPAPVIRNQHLYETFLKKKVTSQFPDEATQLLIFTLRKATTPFSACEDVAALVRQLENTTDIGRISRQSAIDGPPGVRRSEQVACGACRNVNF